MADYTQVEIGEIEAVAAGMMRRARAALGVSSFGAQVLEFPPNFGFYPEHDHADTQQEEVFVTLSGAAEMVLDGETTIELTPEVIVRVGAETKRKITTGEQGVRILALGGVPGEAYEINKSTELGAPDPFAAA